jgi:hypothetical protein
LLFCLRELASDAALDDEPAKLIHVALPFHDGGFHCRGLTQPLRMPPNCAGYHPCENAFRFSQKLRWEFSVNLSGRNSYV